MKQEQKELLLKDLSARLLYEVIVHLKYDKNTSITRELGINSLHDIMVDNAEGRPYLRPMSSMTEEELFEVQNIIGKGVEIRDGFISIIDSSRTTLSYLELQAVFDYLNSIHVDYRGLIPMGLAIEVTKENNPYEE